MKDGEEFVGMDNRGGGDGEVIYLTEEEKGEIFNHTAVQTGFMGGTFEVETGAREDAVHHCSP